MNQIERAEHLLNLEARVIECRFFWNKYTLKHKYAVSVPRIFFKTALFHMTISYVDAISN